MDHGEGGANERVIWVVAAVALGAVSCVQQNADDGGGGAAPLADVQPIGGDAGPSDSDGSTVDAHSDAVGVGDQSNGVGNDTAPADAGALDVEHPDDGGSGSGGADGGPTDDASSDTGGDGGGVTDAEAGDAGADVGGAAADGSGTSTEHRAVVAVTSGGGKTGSQSYKCRLVFGAPPATTTSSSDYRVSLGAGALTNQ